MTETVQRLYDYMKAHRMLCVLSFAVVTLLLVMSVLRLNYKEDIADFLPVDSDRGEYRCFRGRYTEKRYGPYDI